MGEIFSGQTSEKIPIWPTKSALSVHLPGAFVRLFHLFYFHVLDHAGIGLYLEALYRIVLEIADDEDQLPRGVGIRAVNLEFLIELPVGEDALIQLMSVGIEYTYTEAGACTVVVYYMEYGITIQASYIVDFGSAGAAFLFRPIAGCVSGEYTGE
jgi:hypothetical protein